MPFGLANAPSTFQSYIDKALHHLLDITVIVYLDDILIYSEIVKDHEGHVKEVLQALRESGLFAKLEKCEFSVDTVEFLRYIVNPTGIAINPSRIIIVTEWPTPASVKDMQSFLGFCNFYRRFIFQYSKIAKGLTELTKTSKPFT